MPDEVRSDVSVHDFCKWGTSALFDMVIINLDVGYYLLQTSAKALATAEKEKRYKYPHPCMCSSSSFTPMVYSTDRIPVTEAVAAQRHLTLLLRNNLKQKYL